MDNMEYDSFWGHVEALRTTFLRVISIIAIGAVLCFFNYESIFSILKIPLRPQEASASGIERLETFRFVNKDKNGISKTLPEGATLAGTADPSIQKIGTSEYLIPAGKTLTYTQPVRETPDLFLLSPLEGLLTSIKISLWLGLFLTSPVWMYVLVSFLLPGLHRREAKLLLPFLTSSLCLITLGALFALFVTIPISNTYLLAFNEGIGKNLWSLGSYLDYTLFLVLANGIAFESAVIGVFAVRLRLVTASSLAANRRMAILGAFILGALLTPPDVLTQLMLAIPLILLYEGLLLYARVKERGELAANTETGL